MAKSKIVAAAGAAVNAKDPERAARIEAAMSKALLKAMSEGLGPEEQRKAALEARAKALGET